MVSHGEIGRDSCPARGVTDLAIGSSDWLGWEGKSEKARIYQQPVNRSPSMQSKFSLSGESLRRLESGQSFRLMILCFPKLTRAGRQGRPSAADRPALPQS